jgi:hypothetical protein
MNKMKHKAMKIAAVLLSAAALMVLFIACPIESEYLDRIQEQIDAELDSPDVPTYSVTYHGNENDGGTAPSDGNAYEEGETVTVADKGTLTRTDYYFSGWNTLENGDGDGYASGNTFSMPASDVELHAQWSETPTYTVTYNGTGSDGGSVPTDPIYYEEDDWVEVEGPDDMTKSGHFFIEWNTDENGNGDAYQGGAMFQMGNENVILHAIWAPGETKILAYDGTSMDHFGISVSIDGEYAIAGAEYAGTSGNVPGAAYIFHRTAPNIWDTGTKIVGDDTVSGDTFGRSVCISGDYAIVGAPYDDDDGSAAGTAFIFHRTDTNSWDGGIKITASIADANDQFGHSVAIDGDYAIVGVYRDDDKDSDAGAAYIFHRTGPGNTWDSRTKIVASDGASNDYFGWSVDISGDYAIVGAYAEDEGGFAAAGAAYVFHRTGSPNSWDSGTRIDVSSLDPPLEAHDYFGDSVGIDGSCAVIGAPGDDDKGDYAGAAYTYDLVGANWVYRTKLTSSFGDPDDRFGEDVSIDGDNILIGVHRDDDIAQDAGAAFLFHRTDIDTWSEDMLYASDFAEAAGDSYGYSADIDSGYALIGAYEDDEKDTGAGSAYIYYIEQE